MNIINSRDSTKAAGAHARFANGCSKIQVDHHVF